MLSYREVGSGDSLLLIHGWGVSALVWEQLAPLLAPRFRLILIELPGLSGADEAPLNQPYYEYCADQIEEFRRELGIEHWAILAYSIGALASEAYIQRYPQHVTHAAFLCPLYLARPWIAPMLIGQWLNATFPRAASWWITDWRLYGWLLALAFNWQASEQITDWTREIAQRPLSTLKRMLLEAPIRGRPPFAVPNFPPIPTLYIWGHDDALVDYPRPPRPNDVLVPAGHGAPILAPQPVAAAALAFFEQRSTAP